MRVRREPAEADVPAEAHNTLVRIAQALYMYPSHDGTLSRFTCPHCVARSDARRFLDLPYPKKVLHSVFVEGVGSAKKLDGLPSKRRWEGE